MEQQQFRVSLSLGTKLLLSLVALLLVCISFLSVSTILLFTEDKQAYLKRSQSSEATLMGTGVVNTAQHAIDVLRQALGSFDPQKLISEETKGLLKIQLANQSMLKVIQIAQIDAKQGKVLEVFTVGQIPGGLPVIEWSWLEKRRAELERTSFLIFDIAQAGGIRALGILVADLKRPGLNGEIPIAWATLSLDDFARDAMSSRMTVSTRDGWVVFDTWAAKNKSGMDRLTGDPLLTAATANTLAAGTLEFDDKNERFLGSYVRPGLDLVVMARTPWSAVESATYAITEKFILLGLATIALAMIFAIVFSKTITAPINRLYEATREVAAGNFQVVLKGGGRDEIGALTSSFSAMSSKISALISESVRKAHLESELKIASTVQATLIPPSSYNTERLRVHSHYQSAAECGGDWWGYIEGQDRTFLMIADATGHGLPSALITAAARSCFSVLSKLVEDHPEFEFTPARLLSFANRAIYDASAGQIMMTFFVAMLDFKTDRVTFANAGHQAGWVLSPRMGSEPDLKSLVLAGQRLGEAQHVPEYEESQASFCKGDTLFIYTDGLIDLRSSAGDRFGKKRVRGIVEAQLAGGPEAVVSTLAVEMAQHSGDHPLDDDVTFVAAMRL